MIIFKKYQCNKTFDFSYIMLIYAKLIGQTWEIWIYRKTLPDLGIAAQISITRGPFQ